jgi:hypothetical protein
MSPARERDPRTHPIVLLDYRVRSVVTPLGAALIASILYERGASPLAWA